MFWLLVTLTASVSLRAADKPAVLDDTPVFSDLTSEDLSSSLSMTCGKLPEPNKIFCQFVQINIDQTSKEDLAVKKAKVLKLGTSISPEKLKDGTTQFCNRYQEDETLLKTPGKARNRAFYLSRMAKTKRLCHSPSGQALAKGLADLIDFESRTCVITQRSFAIAFKKVTELKWADTTDAQGPCKLVSNFTLERDAKSQYLWKFTQVSENTDLKSPDCRDQAVPKPLTFSSESPRLTTFSCQYVQFGSD